MNTNEIKHQISIKAEKVALLRRLELQAAHYGNAACPPYILIDIDRTTAEIANIDKIISAKADFKEIWIENDTYVNNEYGMTIHVEFLISNRENINCCIIAQFYLSDGRILRGFNKAYYASNGQVCVYSDFIPLYNPARFEDVPLFIPYSELYLSHGKHNLKFNIVLYDYLTESVFAESQYFSFSRNLPILSNNSTYRRLGIILGSIVATLVVVAFMSQWIGGWQKSTSSASTSSPVVIIASDRFIRDYYTMINNRQYNQSWSMLSDDFITKSNKEEKFDFNSYTEYWDSIEQVNVESVEIQNQDTDVSTIFVTLRYDKKDGIVVYQDLYFNLIINNTKDNWLINQTHVIQTRQANQITFERV